MKFRDLGDGIPGHPICGNSEGVSGAARTFSGRLVSLGGTAAAAVSARRRCSAMAARPCRAMGLGGRNVSFLLLVFSCVARPGAGSSGRRQGRCRRPGARFLRSGQVLPRACGNGRRRCRRAGADFKSQCLRLETERGGNRGVWGVSATPPGVMRGAVPADRKKAVTLAASDAMGRVAGRSRTNGRLMRRRSRRAPSSMVRSLRGRRRPARCDRNTSPRETARSNSRPSASRISSPGKLPRPVADRTVRRIPLASGAVRCVADRGVRG